MRFILFPVIQGASNGGKALQTGDHHIILTERTVDDEQVAVFVPAAHNTNMSIFRIEYQIAGLGLIPGDRGTVGVLHTSTSAMADNIFAVADIIESPVHKAGIVQPILYAAQALKDAPSDTELRFVSFTDEENGKIGSRAYTASLTEAEKARMIGAIQFDMLGGLGSQAAMVCTMDGEANWVSDLLQEKDPALARGAETASDHASLQLAGIPSVLLMQDSAGYLYHTAADTADQLDVYAIASAAETAVEAAEEICSPNTPSYQALAREQGDGYTYRQTRQNVIYFSASRADTESYIGAAGELADTWEVSGNGWTDTYETYRYAIRWFDGETPMNTYYQYRNGFLERIEIRPGETGYTQAEVRALLDAIYGAPEREEDGQVSWADPVYSKYITLSSDEAGCLVSVGNYSLGITNVLSSYPVSGGQASISDPEDLAVWDFLCSILPPEARQKIAEFTLFTDGTSNILAYTAYAAQKVQLDRR